jgi:competence protein ComEC
MLLLLMPLQVLIFHGFSFPGRESLAVPLVTFVSVPLILLGMLLHLLPLAAVSVWFAADKSLAGCSGS